MIVLGELSRVFRLGARCLWRALLLLNLVLVGVGVGFRESPMGIPLHTTINALVSHFIVFLSSFPLPSTSDINSTLLQAVI